MVYPGCWRKATENPTVIFRRCRGEAVVNLKHPSGEAAGYVDVARAVLDAGLLP